MGINNNKKHNSVNILSSKSKIKIKNVKKRGAKVIPSDYKMDPNIPEKDYFSDVTGVYYHFKKMEWRTICKDPFKNSRRWQKTYGINKYGFYQAKMMAETKAHETTETNQFLKVIGSLGPNSFNDDLNNKTNYFSPINGIGSRAETPTDNWWTHFSNNINTNNINQNINSNVNKNNVGKNNNIINIDNMNNNMKSNFKVNNNNSDTKTNNSSKINTNNKLQNFPLIINSSHINTNESLLKIYHSFPKLNDQEFYNSRQNLNNNINSYSTPQTYTNMVSMGGMKGINGSFIDTGSYPYRIVLLDNNSYSQHLNSSVLQ